MQKVENYFLYSISNSQVQLSCSIQYQFDLILMIKIICYVQLIYIGAEITQYIKYKFVIAIVLNLVTRICIGLLACNYKIISTVHIEFRLTVWDGGWVTLVLTVTRGVTLDHVTHLQ